MPLPVGPFPPRLQKPGYQYPVPHVHDWRDVEVGCEDCGTHPAVECAADGCDMDEPLDLIYNDDPRATEQQQ